MDEGLNLAEAGKVRDWLKYDLGFLTHWRYPQKLISRYDLLNVPPSEIAAGYDVEIDEVLKAARRKTE